MKLSGWPLAAVIIAFLGALVALSFVGRDTAVLVAVGTAIMAGLGISLGQQNAVKENTNGNMRQLLGMMNGMAHKMADMNPPAKDDEKPRDGFMSDV